MEQLQSFRTELVEWLKEIVPFSKLDLYIRKTREGYNADPEAGRHDNHVNYIFCTDNHRYSISATPWYLGCIASTTFYRPGEDWTRGNDLPDGPFRYETWLHIKDAILRYEMVKLVPVAESSSVGLPDASKVPNPTPEEKECFEANGELWRAKERFERAERAYNGQNRRDAETPLSIGEAREHHASEKVG
jgi:hypothetical protein